MHNSTLIETSEVRQSARIKAMISKLVSSIFFLALLTPECAKPAVEIPTEYSQTSAADLLNQGMQAHSSKDYKKSSLLFLYASLKDPNNHIAFFNRACALALLGERDSAIDALRQAAALNPAWVAQNIADPDLVSIRSDSRVIELLASSDPGSRVAGRKICRKATGPADTAQIETTLNPDHSVTGTGSKTSATLYLNFTGGRWEETGSMIRVHLRFKGQSYGPEGRKEAAEEKTISIDKSELIKSSAECFEIPEV